MATVPALVVLLLLLVVVGVHLLPQDTQARHFLHSHHHSNKKRLRQAQGARLTWGRACRVLPCHLPMP